eukprot:2579527-Pyramimonas_sp.AAC.1
MEAAVQAGDTHMEWNHLEALMRYGGRPGRQYRHPHLLQPSGELVQSAGEEDKLIVEHIAVTEDAEITTDFVLE